MFGLHLSKGLLWYASKRVNKYSTLKIRVLPVSRHFPWFQKHCIMSCFYPAEDLSLSAALFFTMATHYPNGNEHVLLSITHTNLTSTGTMAKKRIKHGLLCSNDLMSFEPTNVEKTGGHCVVFTRLHICGKDVPFMWTPHRVSQQRTL